MAFDDILMELEGFEIGENIREKIRVLLRKEVEGAKYIKGIVIISSEGLPISFYPDGFFNNTAVFPSIAVIGTTVERSLKDLLEDDVDYITVTSPKYILVLKSINGDLLISIICDRGTNLGMIIKKLNKLSRIVKDMISTT